jgi:hypothetical protein
VEPGLLQELQPVFSIHSQIPPNLHSQGSDILDHTILTFQFGPSIFLVPSGLVSDTFLAVLRLSILIVTCRPVAGQRLGKHIPATTNTQETIK